MKETRTEFKYFTIFQWKEEQDYLRQRHQSGWKFVNVSCIGMYHFERCEPEDVVYQLDYNPEGIAQKGEYIQMFRDCGWEYLQDFVGYSYFRKSASQMEGDEEIFCDDASRMEMMKRVFKGRVVPLIVIFFAVIVPQCFVQIHFDHPIHYVLMCAFIGLGAIYLAIFLMFGLQFWNYWKSHKY